MACMLFFAVCPDNLFQQLASSAVRKYIETLKEINLSYFLVDGQVKMKHDSSHGTQVRSCVKHERLKTYPSRPLHLIRACP